MYVSTWNMLQPEFVDGSDPIAIMDQWCKDNCSGSYRFEDWYLNEEYEFELEEDAVAFKLRWT